ncbi:MAG: hypothetical protein Q9182_001306 [Xanthomendoza sp. 2 TL-2023]
MGLSPLCSWAPLDKMSTLRPIHAQGCRCTRAENVPRLLEQQAQQAQHAQQVQQAQQSRHQRKHAHRAGRNRFVSIEPNAAQSAPTGGAQTGVGPMEGPSTLPNYEANSFTGQHTQGAPNLQPQYANAMQQPLPFFPGAGQSTLVYAEQLGWNGQMQQVLGPNEYLPGQYLQSHYPPGQYPLPQYSPGHYPPGQFPLPAAMHNYAQPYHEQPPAGGSIAASQTSEPHDAVSSTSSSQGTCCTGGSEEPQVQTSSPQTDSLDMSALTETLPAEKSNQLDVAVNSENPNQAKEDAVSTAESLQDIISSSPQTTLFTYPSTLATAENPMTMDQFALLQASPQWYHQQVPSYAIDGITGSAAPPAERMNAPELTHACSCGPGCNCQFCTVHPYNQRSRDIAQELYSDLAKDSAYLGSSSRPQSSYDEVSSPIVMQPDEAGAQDFLGNAGEPLGMEDPYHSSNWFIMEYDVCTHIANINKTCRCKARCTCVGCLEHTGCLHHPGFTGHTGEDFFAENTFSNDGDFA